MFTFKNIFSASSFGWVLITPQACSYTNIFQFNYTYKIERNSKKKKKKREMQENKLKKNLTLAKFNSSWSKVFGSLSIELVLSRLEGPAVGFSASTLFFFSTTWLFIFTSREKNKLTLTLNNKTQIQMHLP